MCRDRCLAVFSILCCGARLISAGPLDPPNSPVPTAPLEPRTPITALPFSIEESGSYYLIGDLMGIPGSGGIIIRTDNVSIDLCGFSLAGVPGSQSGITHDPFVSEAGRNIHICNGTIHDWDSTGINIEEGCIAENVIVADNGGDGISVADGSVLRHCTVRGSGQRGFNLVDSSAINCVATANIGAGFRVTNGCAVTSCSSTNNGAYGFNCVNETQVIDCLARGNGATGINGFAENHFVGNICTENTGNGIFAGGSHNRIDGNTCAQNTGTDINVVGANNAIIRNVASTFFVALGNQFGPIENPFTSTHPFANIVFEGP
jgi:hypothetical protein